MQPMHKVMHLKSNARGAEMVMAALPDNVPFSQPYITDYWVKTKRKNKQQKGERRRAMPKILPRLAQPPSFNDTLALRSPSPDSWLCYFLLHLGPLNLWKDFDSDCYPSFMVPLSPAYFSRNALHKFGSLYALVSNHLFVSAVRSD